MERGSGDCWLLNAFDPLLIFPFLFSWNEPEETRDASVIVFPFCVISSSLHVREAWRMERTRVREECARKKMMHESEWHMRDTSFSWRNETCSLDARFQWISSSSCHLPSPFWHQRSLCKKKVFFACIPHAVISLPFFASWSQILMSREEIHQLSVVLSSESSTDRLSDSSSSLCSINSFFFSPSFTLQLSCSFFTRQLKKTGKRQFPEHVLHSMRQERMRSTWSE